MALKWRPGLCLLVDGHFTGHPAAGWPPARGSGQMATGSEGHRIRTASNLRSASRQETGREAGRKASLSRTVSDITGCGRSRTGFGIAHLVSPQSCTLERLHVAVSVGQDPFDSVDSQRYPCAGCPGPFQGDRECGGDPGEPFTRNERSSVGFRLEARDQTRSSELPPSSLA